MAKPILSALIIILLFFITLHADLAANSLDKFLNADKLSERKAAFLDILQNKEAYVEQIQKGFEAFQRTKDKRFYILNRLLYLAAIIRSDKFIDPLWLIFKDFQYLVQECIYCCPIVFTLTLYAIYTDWSPPSESLDNSMVHDLQKEIRREKVMKDVPLVRGHTSIVTSSPDSQDWFKKTELLPVEDLIRMAGPENQDDYNRYLVASVLAPAVMDDKHLTELYWLAIEEHPHDLFYYRCYMYEAILRAERARAQKGGHIH